MAKPGCRVLWATIPDGFPTPCRSCGIRDILSAGRRRRTSRGAVGARERARADRSRSGPRDDSPHSRQEGADRVGPCRRAGGKLPPGAARCRQEEQTHPGPQPETHRGVEEPATRWIWPGAARWPTRGRQAPRRQCAWRSAWPARRWSFASRCKTTRTSKVAEVWYPLVGGLAGFGRGADRGETFVMLPTSYPSIKKIALPFGCFTHQYPGSMNMSYSSVYNTKAGRAMYFASHDTVARAQAIRLLRAVRRRPARTCFACIEHVPFTPPGQVVRGLAGGLAVPRRRLGGRRADLPGVVQAGRSG